MRKRSNVSVRILSGIAFLSIAALFIYSAVVKYGSNTVMGHILTVITTASILIASGAMFISFLGTRRAEVPVGESNERPASGASRQTLKMVGVGFAIVVLGITLGIASSYFGNTFPWLMPNLINAIVAPAIVMIGIFFIVQAVSTALRR
jgi:hypothetical protein